MNYTMGNYSGDAYGTSGDDTFNFGIQPGIRGSMDSIDGGAGYDSVEIRNKNYYFLWSAANVYTMKNIERIIGWDIGGDPFYFFRKLDLKGENPIKFMYGIQGFYGSQYDNDFTGTDYAELVAGNGGNDVIRGSGGNDTIYGDIVENSYNYNYGSFAYNNGADTLFGDDGDDVIYGGGGNDEIRGGAGHDRLFGEDGNDIIYTDGDDEIDGGAGINIVKLEGAAASGTISVGSMSTNWKNISGVSGDVSNNYIVGDNNDNVIYGDKGDDTLSGGDGNDSLYGQDGSDTLNGGNGYDLLDGGAGNDTVSYADSSAGVRVSLALSGPQDTVGSGVDTLVGIENIIGSAFNDVLVGDDGDNILRGGAGADNINGGLGNDIMDGGAGVDGVNFSGLTSGVTVNLSITTAQNTGAAGIDTITGFENVGGSNYATC